MSVSQATAAGQGPAQPGDVAGQVQGTPAAGQGQDGFWNLFPSVPEDQRPMLEPHIRGMQQYITQLQGQYAPYKGIADAGASAEDLQALHQFGQRLASNPVDTAMELLSSLQNNGTISQDLDLEMVKAVASGTAPPESGDILESGEGVGDEMPEWAMTMQQQMAQMGQYFQTQEANRQKAAQDAALNTTLKQATDELQKAQVDLSEYLPEGTDVNRWLTGLLVTNNMDVNAVVQTITGFRDAATKGLMQEADDSQPGDLELPNGVPAGRRQPSRTGDSFKDANAGALNMLQQRQRAEAQGV